ncbi:MAG TPA: hypothetical protein DFS52_04405 [Myxococcales bacterium]|mgnify:FL=1|jgi:anti-sigma factor RsiW|nr:hypothetical protein [Myxococcales bacterium]
MESACHSYQMLLSAYSDGEASPRERAQVELHLSSCGDCRARVEDLKALAATVSAHLRAQVDEVDFSSFADDVLKRIGPDEPGLVERMRICWAEVMAYHRTAVISSVATAAVTLAIAAPLIWQLATRSAAGQVPQVVLRQMQLENPNIQPVVMDMGDGKTLIMFVDQPAPGAGAATPPVLKATPPTGGDL